MPKSEIELPARNQSSQNRENRFENIHFLVNQIPKESYSSTKFFDEYKSASQEQLLKYCEFLYRFLSQHEGTEVTVKDSSFLESDSIISLVAYLENQVLSNHLLIDKIDIENGLVRLESSVDAFNSYQVFDLNIAYLDFKMDHNLKVGVTSAISKLNFCDSGVLFDYHEIEYLSGEFFDEPEDSEFTPKQLKSFDKTLVKYQEKFNSFLGKKYNPAKKYTEERDLHIQKLINGIISYDTEMMWSHIVEKGDGEASFSSMFIPVLRNVTPVSERMFDQILKTRCKSLGEMGVEYVSQYFEISENSIDDVISDEQIKELQVYESNISDLTYILNNYDGETKQS